MSEKNIALLSAALEVLEVSRKMAEETGATLACEAIADAVSRTWEARERERKAALAAEKKE